MIKVSVIVIIYRIEKYLSQCIESILAQTYKDFELILVDDGSPDKCPQICDEYVKKDKRVRVIHQSNQGSVMARWNGILASKGEYISLIDGDDWLDPDMYERMMGLAERNDADIVITGYKEGTEKKYEERCNALDSGIYKDERLNDLLSKSLYIGNYYEPGIVPALWNKIIRRELFYKDYIPADYIVKMGDDATVSYPMLARANTIVIENSISSYHYRIVENSQSRKYDPQYVRRCLKLFESLKYNLELNKEMLHQLKFYSLFIMEIGILNICSKSSGLSINQQKAEINYLYNEYVNLNIDMIYPWNSIAVKEKKWLKAFIEGKINLAIFQIYKCKFIKKFVRIFNRIFHLSK